MKVSLVIPGRNCAATLRPCLESVIPMLQSPDSPLTEVLFIDDGSTDETAEIAKKSPVTYVLGEGKGPGAARNLGWRRAVNELVWFIDSDTVAAPDALDHLVPHMENEEVGGVSGSYDNAVPDSLLACLIHEEIIERHLAMPTEVNFLATFNVIYRREILAELDGFDERYLKAQDAEFSFRVMDLGKKLHFDIRSRVAHHHVTELRKYLRVQRHQGFWRVYLHLEHEGHSTGDSYSSLLDHIQPPLAMLCLASLPFTMVGLPGAWLIGARLISIGLFIALFALQFPLTGKLVKRTKKGRYWAFAPMSFIRAFARGIGMSLGTCHYFLSKKPTS
ncbi:MAG: glycosyltransferase involved in cell wall biosynthesis [Planctomycetota bacterium]|jgi:glycosyltransferase involved in cell wall biosynthesis